MNNRAFASIRFMGEHLDPLEVTKALLLPSDHSHRRGEPNIVRRRTDGIVRHYAPRRFGMWSMSSEAWVESDKINDHICWLLEQLEEREEAVRSVLSPELKADIFCFSNNPGSEPALLPETTIDRATRLGIKIEIDHYDSTEEFDPA